VGGRAAAALTPSGKPFQLWIGFRHDSQAIAAFDPAESTRQKESPWRHTSRSLRVA
jgi:hypothetical protein